MIGDEKPKSFWVFNDYRRRYRKNAAGQEKLIWAEHWEEKAVIGETRVSWLIGPDWDPRKIPKRGPWPMRGICRSRGEVKARAWAESMRGKIYNRLNQIYTDDAAEVVRIARALGIELPENVASWFPDAKEQ